ncbi:MAG: AmmeMemoRadiSam system protein B [Deltaproteobacteria bacterium]|jgi:AmmeMemoRadiSam system protein B/AmmeMemoRadiSam system protein A
MTSRFLFVVTLAVSLLSYTSANTPDAAAMEGNSMSLEQTRESVIAGSWYPGNASRLQQDIQAYLGQASVADFNGGLIALISPHAGYRYSGQVAAYAYKILETQKYATVVVIAPSHRSYFQGVSLYDRGGYRTPLGVVPLDREFISALKEREGRIRYVPDAHTEEHSLEIQLPFLQVLLPDFKLVPLVMGNQDFATCQWLAEAVSDCIKKNRSTLVVASSDLSHFHPYQQAKKLDQVVLDKIGEFDPRGLSDSLATGKCEACGGGPMVTAMLIARRLGANRSQVLHYANSGDVTGDHSGVVGYVAAALWGAPKATKGKKPQGQRVGIDLGLTAEEKNELLKIARDVVECHCRGEKPVKPVVDSSTLHEPRGAFVTLHKDGKLRGCIGQIRAQKPLIETIAEMAEAAAFRDPRFPPVTSEELDQLEYEISVLTPLRRIEDVEEIKVGIHGIYMKRGGSGGLLLPQVATDWGWDRTTFLEHTCTKAGLPEDAWRDKKTEIYIFSADVFSPGNL